jgi:hypothetical protein
LLNTNGGDLSYMHSGMYGIYALQERVRLVRGTAPAQISGPKISVCHGVGGMLARRARSLCRTSRPNVMLLLRLFAFPYLTIPAFESIRKAIKFSCFPHKTKAPGNPQRCGYSW